MRLLNLASPAIATLGFAAGAALAQGNGPTEIDVSALGPQVGEPIPAFSLPDQQGNLWTDETIIGPRGAMLVFIRSADW